MNILHMTSHVGAVSAVLPSSLLARVTAVMERIAPLKLADHKWDNVGVLVEAPFFPSTPCPQGVNGTLMDVNRTWGTVLLTNDLTRDVLEEGISKGVGVIIAYHPPIFTPLKRLRLSEEKECIVLRAIAAGISIYSPHTALDAAECGVNDWLASLLDDRAYVIPIQPVPLNNDEVQTANTLCMRPVAAATADAKLMHLTAISEDCVNKDSAPCDGGFVADPLARRVRTGYGRIAQLHDAVTLSVLVERIKNGLQLSSLRVATPPGWNNGGEKLISTVALCAGSGGSVFRQLKQHVDVLWTGEMGHHEVLAANANGQVVILCEHSNTERGYLRDILCERLKRDLGDDVTVIFSQSDAEPLKIW